MERLRKNAGLHLEALEKQPVSCRMLRESVEKASIWAGKIFLDRFRHGNRKDNSNFSIQCLYTKADSRYTKKRVIG